MVNLNPMADRFMVKWQSDLVKTIESMVPVCDKRYHIYNRFRHFWAEIKKLWNYPLVIYGDNDFVKKVYSILYWISLYIDSTCFN